MVDSFPLLIAYSIVPVATSLYWNAVHEYSPDDVYADKEGCQTMHVLGRNIAFLIKSIALGKEQYGLPKKKNGKE